MVYFKEHRKLTKIKERERIMKANNNIYSFGSSLVISILLLIQTACVSSTAQRSTYRISPTEGLRSVTSTLTEIKKQTKTPLPTEKSYNLTAQPMQLKIGDIVIFGYYANEPILWQIIGDSANPDANMGDLIFGDPLLFSYKVLCNKAFDAAGLHEANEQRIKSGSNLWSTSSIRSWLNSIADAGDVNWLDGNPPDPESVTSNPYGDEKGFLADGNFTSTERTLIKFVTLKTVLYYDDKNLAEGGSVAYDYGGYIDTIVGNYDNAWYQNVTDQVFLLDPKQIYQVYKLFGSYFYQGKSNYWLRAPDSPRYLDSSSAKVLYINHINGHVLYRVANDGSIGVRPALTLDNKLIILISGDGSYGNPYTISGQ
jgi:hypothetical protein